MTQTPKAVSLEWIGPSGHVSPFFGPLQPGHRYPCPAGLADSLIRQHPQYWARADAPSASVRPKE